MTTQEPKFYKADTLLLLAAIDSTGKSKSQIAAKGEMAVDTLNKALRGARILRAKASGICNGLNAYGCKPTAKREVLFPHAE